MNKTWIVNFKLKELSASHWWQSVQVDASNIGLAINRGWAVVKTRPAVKGKRINKVEITAEICQNSS